MKYVSQVSNEFNTKDSSPVDRSTSVRLVVPMQQSWPSNLLPGPDFATLYVQQLQPVIFSDTCPYIQTLDHGLCDVIYNNLNSTLFRYTCRMKTTDCRQILSLTIVAGSGGITSKLVLTWITTWCHGSRGCGSSHVCKKIWLAYWCIKFV